MREMERRHSAGRPARRRRSTGLGKLARFRWLGFLNLRRRDQSRRRRGKWSFRASQVTEQPAVCSGQPYRSFRQCSLAEL